MNGRCADVARPFMTDSALLASLDGQQYLVLRPQGEIEALWDASRESLRRSIPQAVAYVNGHSELPVGGQQNCPLVATETARSWPTDLPTWGVVALAMRGRARFSSSG